MPGLPGKEAQTPQRATVSVQSNAVTVELNMSVEVRHFKALKAPHKVRIPRKGVRK